MIYAADTGSQHGRAKSSARVLHRAHSDGMRGCMDRHAEYVGDADGNSVRGCSGGEERTCWMGVAINIYGGESPSCEWRAMCVRVRVCMVRGAAVRGVCAPVAPLLCGSWLLEIECDPSRVVHVARARGLCWGGRSSRS